MEIKVPDKLVDQTLALYPSAKGLMNVLVYASVDGNRAADLIKTMNDFSFRDRRDFVRLLDMYTMEELFEKLEDCRAIRRFRAHIGARLRVGKAVKQETPGGMKWEIDPGINRRMMNLSFFPGGVPVRFEVRKREGLKASAEIIANGNFDDVFINVWRVLINGKVMDVTYRIGNILREAFRQNIVPEVAATISG